jgi:hypothetical protein
LCEGMTCVDRPGPKGGQHVPAIEIGHRHLRAWRSSRARQAVGDFVPVRRETNKVARLGATGSAGAACGAFESGALSASASALPRGPRDVRSAPNNGHDLTRRE